MRLSMDAWQPLAGRTAVVTGGASGIGLAIARRLAAAGARGAILDLRAAATDDLPDGWQAFEVDVRDDASVGDAMRRAVEPLGGIDVLVLAAGIVPPWTGLTGFDPVAWDNVLRVNVFGVAATLAHALRDLNEGAAVVAIASLNAWRGDANIPAYAASKHAVLGIVRSAALELGRRNIRVNAIAPGPIATDALLERMQTRERERGTAVADALGSAAELTALGRIATVDEVAKVALFLATDLSSGLTGQMIPVDGGLG
jgi:NAD(P)-dependent dehydrogenase (short-subunit alcohol dehydrogenase family)